MTTQHLVEDELSSIEETIVTLRDTVASLRNKGLAIHVPTIALIDESSVPNDWQRIANALQYQADNDFAPYWFRTCKIVYCKTAAEAPPSSWWLVILDDSDMANALGYHDLTTAGLPTGKVFAKTDAKYGLDSAVTASHELLEMLGDPWIDEQSGPYQVGGTNRIVAREVCDPVEADALGYSIDGIRVSDFATPAWFHPGMPGPYSFKRRVPTALTLAPGGYISYLDFQSANGWQQLTASGGQNFVAGHPRLNPQEGSRRERRQRGKDAWELSTAA
jgi:hypothetical protein